VLALAGCRSEAPPALPDAVRVVVVGDFGTGDEDALAVAQAIRDQHRAAAIDGLVTTGDNIYPDGGPEHFDEAWRRPYGWTQAEGVPVVASLGNHDVERDARPVMRLLGMEARWYRARVGPLQIIVLDSTEVGSARQRAFLVAELASPLARGAEYRIVVLHHPPFSCSRHKNTEAVLRSWQPVIQQGDVDLVLSGHDHAYQRFEPVGGTTYIVTGGGGRTLYDVEDCPDGTPELLEAAESHHYLLIEATDERLRVQAVSPDDRVLDVVTVAS